MQPMPFLRVSRGYSALAIAALTSTLALVSPENLAATHQVPSQAYLDEDRIRDKDPDRAARRKTERMGWKAARLRGRY